MLYKWFFSNGQENCESEVGIIGDDPIGLLELSKLRGAKNYNSWKISARIKKAKSIEQTT